MSEETESKVLAPIQASTEVTETAWAAAGKRQAAVRAAVARLIDAPSEFRGVVDQIQAVHPPLADAGNPGDPIAEMNRRGLLLADALQRRALLKIAETGLALDQIDRAVNAIVGKPDE